ncbi:MAG: ATP-binding cassette domain-containing protein [Clostridium fessum]
MVWGIGSGKTTIGRALIRLYDPTAGQITFDGMDISGKMSRQTEARLRSDMQMIFQDPMACLNPRQKVADIIAQGLDIHHRYHSQKERTEMVADILHKVGAWVRRNMQTGTRISFLVVSGSVSASPGRLS